jgi:hypothetical protein
VAIVCDPHKLIYFPVPKNACTSIKNTLWELTHGRKFEPFVNAGKTIENIHQIYVSRFFSMGSLEMVAPRWAEYFRFTVVRDPVDRLVSAYRNRVLFHLELRQELLEQSGLKSPDLIPTPDFAQFVRYLPLYQRASRAIAHHTAPQKAFIGDRLGIYDFICRFETLDELESELSQRLERQIKFPVSENLGPSKDGIVVDSETRQLIYQYYEEDYELLRDYYLPTAVPTPAMAAAAQAPLAAE